MTLDTRSLRSRDILRQIVVPAAMAMTMWGCTHATNGGDDRYAHGRIHVDAATRTRWDAAEREVEAAGARIKPLRDSDASTSIPFRGDAAAELNALAASERHGAGDKRILSVLDTTGGRRAIVSSGIIGEVTLVKGSEYKSESDFRAGWLPLAIVVLPPRGERDAVVYPKLKLHGGTSWIYVRERADSSWVGAVVRLVAGRVVQEPLSIAASSDSVEPIVGARFVWEDDDESIWGTCGGKCCKATVVHQSQ